MQLENLSTSLAKYENSLFTNMNDQRWVVESETLSTG